MPEREKRATSIARPGDIVNKAKQQRRSREEIDRDNLAIAERKARREPRRRESKALDVSQQRRKRSARTMSMLGRLLPALILSQLSSSAPLCRAAGTHGIADKSLRSAVEVRPGLAGSGQPITGCA
ncbi:hypothetical protein B0H14DRAFT_2614981 [Mycena olivaceomarginata]|nr:hypothetical protein B0H14DRAFT_2614981 [Mycena olivaceomarginata]